MAFEAFTAVVPCKEQTVFTFLAMRSFVIGTLMTLFTFGAVFCTFRAFTAFFTVISVIKLFYASFAVRADLTASVTVVAFEAGITPCGTSAAMIETFRAYKFLTAAGIATSAMPSFIHAAV
ncbi:MAG: hypothetical protein IJW14_01755 [Oscillospiraceae bacterium]|nr:hypothetical protein [Oscillospiraceae bacterium]